MEESLKQLLLTDLCARLPYGVYVNYKNVENKEGIIMLNPYNIQHIYSGWWKKYKPYLRPMDSMTYEEKIEYLNICGNEMENPIASPRYSGIDYLNSIHVDYRGLIPQNMAIEITEENNPYKN